MLDVSIYTRHDALPTPFEQGVVLVDKPLGWTSFRVVKKLRWLFKVAKVGHAGTLDPMATGLLLVLVGKQATRQQDAFMGLPKVYTGTLRLGETTPSYDAETAVSERRDVDLDDLDARLDAVRKQFIGDIVQRPPVFSAIKVDGERLYKKARRGDEAVEIPTRTVTITEFALVARRGVDVDFRVACSKGTYIRSLAHDLGEALGTGAHLTALRREAIGAYDVGDAWEVEQLERSVADR